MEFVSMRDFTASPKKTQKRLNANGELVITKNGTPTMLVIDIANRDFIRLIDYLHRQEALDILHEIQTESTRGRKDIIGMNEIDTEIAAYRQEKNAE